MVAKTLTRAKPNKYSTSLKTRQKKDSSHSTKKKEATTNDIGVSSNKYPTMTREMILHDLKRVAGEQKRMCAFLDKLYFDVEKFIKEDTPHGNAVVEEDTREDF